MLKYFIVLLVFDMVMLGPVKFAAIADYGKGESAETDVSDMIDTWNVDFIM